MSAEGGLRREEDFLPDVQHSDEEEEEVDFPPDFRKYMKKRKLNFSRLKIPVEYDDDIRGGVFWNQEDDGCVGLFDEFGDPIPDIRATRKVRRKIRHALHELILLPELARSLVQFWAPTKTSEGQTLLKSQNEPFALSDSYPDEAIDNMCKYRMEMCEEYPYFYADAKCSEQQLGLPGRVYLHQFTEFNFDIRNYSKEEYPQLELALRCGIVSVWTLPVLELSGQSCLGVLEVVFFHDDFVEYFDEGESSSKFYDIFQEFGLLCGYKHFDHPHFDMQGKKEAIRDASTELRPMLESVCETHSLPLALTWLSGGLCSDVLENVCNFNRLSSRIGGGDPEVRRSYFKLRNFMKTSRLCLLKKGQFTGRKLPFPNLLYRSDVKQFSIAEYPLVPYARKCELSGCFTMCLQSSCTGDQLYVIELFFPASNDNNENILTTLRLILNTMEEHSKNFKLASGQGFGEELSVEVIDFKNGQKSHSVKMIPARPIPLHERLMSMVRQLDEPSVDAVNSRMHVATEAQNSNLPSLDSLQNEEVTTQLDSSHQLSMDPSNEGQDAITLPRNKRVVSSSEKGKRKMQDGEDKDPGVIDFLNDGEVQLQLGQESGEAFSLEVIDFLNGQKSHSSTIIPATRSIPSLELLKDEEVRLHLGQLSMGPSNKGKNVVSVERNILLGSCSKVGKRKKQDRELRRFRSRIAVSLEEILECSGMKHEDAARKLNVTQYTLRRVCKSHGIHRWPPSNKGKVHPSMPIIAENQGQSPHMHSNEDSCSVGNINQGFRDEDEKVHPFLPSLIENQRSSRPLNYALHPNEYSCNVAEVSLAFQNSDMVTIKAKWEHFPTIKFQLPLTSGLGELHQEVYGRLKLEAGSYDVKYEDENDLILIAVDEDLQEYMQSSISQDNKAPVVVQLKRK